MKVDVKSCMMFTMRGNVSESMRAAVNLNEFFFADFERIHQNKYYYLEVLSESSMASVHPYS